MAKKVRSNDACWEVLFERYHILQKIEKHGIFEITAEQIKEEREPRLMTKYDHYDLLPDIFKDNNLSILPNKNGSYLIGKFNTHQEVVYENVAIRQIKDRSDLESLDGRNLFSEAISLNYALATGMLKDVIGEACEQTISGRMKSSNFKFKIGNPVSGLGHEIKVDNVQIEIDGGYESKHKLLIIEAKKGKCDDFIIRQLYFPYRLRKEKVSKEVVPVFMTESNGIFSFFVFKFEDDNDYNSIKLVKQLNYSINFEPITKEDIKSLDKIKEIKEPEVPFPQADDFEKCINVLELLRYGDRTKEEISDTFGYVKRQGDYYANAARYLGLVEESGRGSVKLTNLGKEIISLQRKDRNLRLIKLILSHEVFRQVYLKYSKEGKISTDDTVKIMKKYKLYNVDSNKTYRRRASTIKCWCGWIMDTINEKILSAE